MTPSITSSNRTALINIRLRVERNGHLFQPIVTMSERGERERDTRLSSVATPEDAIKLGIKYLSDCVEFQETIRQGQRVLNAETWDRVRCDG